MLVLIELFVFGKMSIYLKTLMHTYILSTCMYVQHMHAHAVPATTTTGRGPPGADVPYGCKCRAVAGKGAAQSWSPRERRALPTAEPQPRPPKTASISNVTCTRVRRKGVFNNDNFRRLKVTPSQRHFSNRTSCDRQCDAGELIRGTLCPLLSQLLHSNR